MDKQTRRLIRDLSTDARSQTNHALVGAKAELAAAHAILNHLGAPYERKTRESEQHPLLMYLSDKTALSVPERIEALVAQGPEIKEAGKAKVVKP